MQGPQVNSSIDRIIKAECNPESFYKVAYHVVTCPSNSVILECHHPLHLPTTVHISLFRLLVVALSRLLIEIVLSLSRRFPIVLSNGLLVHGSLLKTNGLTSGSLLLVITCSFTTLASFGRALLGLLLSLNGFGAVILTDRLNNWLLILWLDNSDSVGKSL